MSALAILRCLPSAEFMKVGQLSCLSYSEVTARISSLSIAEWLHPRIVFEMHYTARDRTTKKFLRYINPRVDADAENKRLWSKVHGERHKYRKVAVFLTERANLIKYSIPKVT